MKVRALGRLSKLLGIVSFVFCVVSYGQNSPPATISFSFDFPGSIPAHYGISLDSGGHGTYVSDGRLTKDADPDQNYNASFTVSQEAVNHAFDLARQAHYFEGNLDSKKKNIASTGDKTLMYKDAQKDTIQTYNYSQIPAVQELTTFFQNLSATLEFGHRLEYDYRYQKLALDEDTKAMDDAASRGQLVELKAIAPILQKIVDDQSVINVVRVRVERLLEHAGAASN
jgi:hypothetical protein